MTTLASPDGIVFDCDATLSAVAGIDALADFKHKEKEIAKINNQLKVGSISAEVAYRKRIDALTPSRSDLEILANRYLEQITEGAADVIVSLRVRGIRVGIVSTGLREAILPLAAQLHIAKEDVFAVDLLLDAEGNYFNIVPTPLMGKAGKAEMIKMWKKQHQLNCVYMVGDNMTDIAAKADEAADAVIGYGGIVARPEVEKAADIFYRQTDLRGLIQLLKPRGA